MNDNMSRRDFAKTAAVATGVTVIGVGGVGAKEYETSKVLNYNENMEYRRLGKTGVMVSAASEPLHRRRHQLCRRLRRS
jgi:hypothetical protein